MDVPNIKKDKINMLTEIKEVDDDVVSATSDDKIEDAVKFQMAHFLQDRKDVAPSALLEDRND